MTEAAPSIENAEPTLRLRGVGRRFGGLLAVDDVDLDVAHGERRAILGPNGAGKTTLFNVICGDIPASAGKVELFGEDVTRRPARYRAKCGLARTYQQSRLFNGLTVEDSIYLSIIGVDGGRLRPVVLPGRDRAHPRASASGRRQGGDLAQARRARRLALTRRASSDRDRDGSRGGAEGAHARRAGIGPLARRAPAAHGAPERARPEHHAHPDRARHGHRALASPSG